MAVAGIRKTALGKSAAWLLSITICVSLVACGTGNPDETVEHNEAPDCKSALHMETGDIFSLDDSITHFVEAFGSGERIDSALEVHHEGDFDRFRFYTSDENEALLVEFLDGIAVQILATSKQFKFTGISFDTKMDELPDTFIFVDPSIDNNRHAYRDYDSDGNIIALSGSGQAVYRLEVLAHFAAGGNVITTIILHWLEPLRSV